MGKRQAGRNIITERETHIVTDEKRLEERQKQRDEDRDTLRHTWSHRKRLIDRSTYRSRERQTHRHTKSQKVNERRRLGEGEAEEWEYALGYRTCEERVEEIVKAGGD